MALKLLALLHLISLRLAASGALTRHTGPAAAEAFSARRLAGETQFGTSQVFHAEPPWRDPSAAVRRDSLSLKWALDPSVLTVELQHDKGFGGDFLATVPIRAEYTRYQLNGLRVGGTYRFRLRAETAAGWGVWSPEAALRAVEPPSAPSGLHAVWHPQALRPQLCWAAPEDLGGANGADGADLVVQLYRVWLHMDGHVRLLATLDRTDRTCWEVDVPQLFSESLVLSVSAANQDFDGPKSETLELLTTGPPGQPGAPVLENSTAGWVTLRWAPPTTRGLHCDAARPSCQELSAQFGRSAPTGAVAYELYWDAGLGTLPSELVYSGAEPWAEVALGALTQSCLQFRVRAVVAGAGGSSGPFSEILAVLPTGLAAAPELRLESARAGLVKLSWTLLPTVSGCNWWFEVEVSDVAEGNTTILQTGLDTMEVAGLGVRDYGFRARSCASAGCGAWSNGVRALPKDPPEAPKAPYSVSYQDGMLTLAWTEHEDLLPHASGASQFLVEAYEVFGAESLEGPYWSFGSVAINQPPQLKVPCNETGAYPALFAKVSARFTGASGAPGAAWSDAAALLCAPRPAAPPQAVAKVRRVGTGALDVLSDYEVEVALTLEGQASSVAALHRGWRATLEPAASPADAANLSREVLISDPWVRSYTFRNLPAATVWALRYGVNAMSGEGPWSPELFLRTNVRPPQPVLRVDWSSDEIIALSWTWEPSADEDSIVSFRLYVDWRDGENYFDLQQPTLSLQVPSSEVNCTDLFAESFSQHRLFFAVAAVSSFGEVGDLSAPVSRLCSALPEKPSAPSLADLEDFGLGGSYASLLWAVPNLHGAPLVAVNLRHFTGGAYGYRLEELRLAARDIQNDLLNVSANLSQPARFAVQAVSEVGSGPWSDWLDLTKLALPPLPPRVSIASSTDTEIHVAWSLDRSKERGAFTTGYYVYVSVDGTTWPNEEGYIATWQDEFTTTYTMDCTATSLLGGQSRSKQFLWFKVAARSIAGRGPLSIATAGRCSQPPTAVQNLRLSGATFEGGSLGTSYVTWDEPADLHDAVLLGYKVYVDDGNSADAQDLYTLRSIIEDPAIRTFRHDAAEQGRSYKYKVTAVSEAGEGTAVELSLAPAVAPLAPEAPRLLDDCTIVWDTTKALCPIPQNYVLTITSVDIRFEASIDAPRVFPFITVTAGTLLEVSEEQLGSDGRLYLKIPLHAGWLWDDTPLSPAEGPLATRLPKLKFQWTWTEEVRALGGAPLTAWHIYRSTDGVTWPSNVSGTALAEARNASLDCEVAEVGLPFWVRLTAVNDIGESPPSEALKMRCALPPGLQPAPTQTGSDITSMVLSFNPLNLHGAELLAHRLTYALDSDLGILAPTQLEISAQETYVNISGLLPWSTYVVKVQAITEAGMSLDPDWQVNMTTGNVISVDAPTYLSSDGSLVRFSLANLTGGREWEDGYQTPSFNVYITADDRAWPSVLQPTVVTDAELLEHDCSNTPDYAQLDASGNPTMVDHRYGLVYVRVSLSTALGPGDFSPASAFFCSPLPLPPAVELLSADPHQVMLKWANPDLFNAPLVGYNIYMDDGLGGDVNLYTHLPAEEVAYDETNESVILQLHPLDAGKWYRIRVTAISAAGESENAAIFSAQTCASPPSPEVWYLPAPDALKLRWNASLGSGVCSVHGYQVVAEMVNLTGVENLTLVTMASEILGPDRLDYVVPNLVPQAEYRFQVHAFAAANVRVSGWTLSQAVGVPMQMEPPSHDLNLSTASAVYLNWTSPDLNGGMAVGFELFRNDGPGTMMRSSAEECMVASAAASCSDCFVPVAQAPFASGCFVTGLALETTYRFQVRALNHLGAGPLSEASEIWVGGAPAVTRPWLVAARSGNCTMAWHWAPATENGRVVHSYELLVQAADGSETLLSLPGTVDAPLLDLQAEVAFLTPHVYHRAAVRAISALGASEWSEWSAARLCIDAPLAPGAPRRGSATAGRVKLQWDEVTAALAGEDPANLGVDYDLWGSPDLSDGSNWRRLYQVTSHEADPLGGPAIAVDPSVEIDTFPETPVTRVWGFKLRLGNRNGFGPFSPYVALSTAQLATEVLSLQASVTASGILLTWLPPISDGFIPLSSYEARCGGAWEAVANTVLSHEVIFSPSPGLVTCEVRANNAVGLGPAASTSLLVL